MKVRFSPRGLEEAKRIRTWWVQIRPAARDRFDHELAALCDRLLASPQLGTVYRHSEFGVVIRRALLPRSKNHVYYAVEDDLIVILSVWAAPKGRAPKL